MLLEVLAIFNLIFSVYSNTPAPENKYLTYIQAVMRKVFREHLLFMVLVSHIKNANGFNTLSYNERLSELEIDRER